MHDYLLLINSLRIDQDFERAREILLLDLNFSLEGNPFVDIAHTRMEQERRRVVQELRALEPRLQVVSDLEALKVKIKGKKVLSDDPQGPYEQEVLRVLSKEASLTRREHHNYLLNEVKLEGAFPFTTFRKHAEAEFEKNYQVASNNPALASFRAYLEAGHGHRYFETRNAFCGENFSTQLSTPLALGQVSVPEVLSEVCRIEQQRGSNKSTYWIKFELMWREYFYWLFLSSADSFFRARGLKGGSKQLAPISERMYLEQMNTHPLIRAMHRELHETGYLSNRTRQIYASFLIHGTTLDWRYGAWYFQLYLKDYDLYSNWGNWLYLSGFGTDPRGRRYFDLEKQQKTYDPSCSYLQRWG